MKELLLSITSLILGIVSQTKFECSEMIILILIILILLLHYRFRKRFSKNDYLKIIIFFSLYLYGFVSSYMTLHHYNYKEKDYLYINNNYDGVILDVIPYKDKDKALVYIKKIHEKIYLYINDKYKDNIFPGDLVKLNGIFLPIEKPTNIGEYNVLNTMYLKKVYYNFYGEIINVENRNVIVLSQMFKIKTYIEKIFDEYLSEEEASVSKAMILGENHIMDSTTYELYRKGGILHILAISGLHIGILIRAVRKILKKIVKNKIIFLIVMSIFLIFYVFLTGASISAIRASIMVIFNEYALSTNKKYNSLMGLLLTAFIILFLNPRYLFDIGFVLSFFAVFAFYFQLDLKGFAKKIKSNISVCLITYPILIYNFYSIQGLSLISNVMIIPLAMILIMCNVFLIASSFINLTIAKIFAKMVSIILSYYKEVLTFLSGLKGFDIPFGHITLTLVLMIYIIYFIIYFFLKKQRRQFHSLIYILIVTILIFVIENSKCVEITFIDVGHGDAVFIYDEYSNKSMLVDGGGNNDNDKDTGYYDIYPYLKYKGIDKIDLCIITHPDRDHIKGIYELLDLIQINKVAFPYGIRNSIYYDLILNKCAEKGIEKVYLKEGDSFEIGEVKCIVLNPSSEMNELEYSTNNYSIVLDVDIYDKKILLTGDIEKEIENKLIHKIRKNYYILKAPHHGSSTSCSQLFVDFVNPQYLIVSGNQSNINKFNKKNKYKFYNSHILSTYKSGMIIFKIKGE